MKSTYLLLVAVMLVITTSAQNKFQWKTASANGYSYKYVSNDPMQARFYTLKNGLTVVLSVNHKEPRIAYRMAVRAGSNNDPKEHTGLAHYLEHLMFKGTSQYGSLDWQIEKPLLDKIEKLYEQYNSSKDENSRKDIYKEIDKISGEAAKYAIAGEYKKLMESIGSKGTNAHTSVEETVYEEDFPSNATDIFLKIQADRFRDPVFRIFHTELETVYEEKNRSADNEASKVQEAMLANIFPTHNYGVQTTIGTIEHLKNPSLIAIRDFYNTYYVPNNMAVIMVGDFNPDEMVGKIEKAFAYMQPKPVKEYKGPKEKPIDGPLIKEVYSPSSESLRILFRTAAAGTREALLANITSAVLSNGTAGLIDLNLNKAQKVLGAGCGNWMFKDYGLFYIAAAPKEGQNLEELKALILEQLEILKRGDFEESLLKAIVANSKLGLLRGLEYNANRIYGLTDEFIKSGGTAWDKNIGEIDAIRNITKKELVAFANTLFTDKNYVVINKRNGEDNSVVKVEKPPITPVETNRDKTSPYVKSVLETPLPSFKPVWVDYTNDIQLGKVGTADLIYVQNKENELFTLTYNFNMGSWNNKLLSIATQYFEFLGTDKFSSDAISKEFYTLACNFYISATTEQTTITISGLQENFDKAVVLVEHLLSECKADEPALEGLKSMYFKSREDNKLNKDFISTGLKYYATYGAKNPFNNILSNNELQNLNSGELINLLHSLSSFEHTVTYYGPQPISTISKKLQLMHKLPNNFKPIENAVKFEPVVQNTNKVLFTEYDAVQTEIYWYKNLEKYNAKVEPILHIFNNYFGGGMGSIVFNSIRESKALAYATYSLIEIPYNKKDNFIAKTYNVYNST